MHMGRKITRIEINDSHVRVDCDGDAVLLRVEQVGGVACHEGYASCFFRRVEGEDWRVVAPRLEPPSAG